MAYLLKYLNEDLMLVAHEMGVEVSENYCKVDIKKEIIAVKEYDEEVVKFQLDAMVEDRRVREERAYEIEKLRITQVADISLLPSGSGGNFRPVKNMKYVMQKYDLENSDMVLFLTLFERQARKVKIEERKFGPVFAPYLSQGRVNNTEATILRDSGTSVDVALAKFVNPEDYTGEVVWVKQALENYFQCLPITKIVLEGVGFGCIKTKAAIVDNSVDMEHYLLGNYTQELIDSIKHNSQPLNVVVTRSQAQRGKERTKGEIKLGKENKTDQGEFKVIPEEVRPELQLPVASGSKCQFDQIDSATFCREQKLCTDLKCIWEKVGEGKSTEFIEEKGLLFRKTRDHMGTERKQVLVPACYRKSILSLCREGLGGHTGVTKTKDKLLRYYYWPQFTKDADVFVKTCEPCQRVGKAQETRKAPLELVPIIKEVFSRVCIDTVGPLPCSGKGNRHLVTALCVASKYPEAVLVADIRSETVTGTLLLIFSRWDFTKVGIGVVLGQKGAKDLDHPVLYLSRKGSNLSRDAPYIDITADDKLPDLPLSLRKLIKLEHMYSTIPANTFKKTANGGSIFTTYKPVVRIRRLSKQEIELHTKKPLSLAILAAWNKTQIVLNDRKNGKKTKKAIRDKIFTTYNPIVRIHRLSDQEIESHTKKPLRLSKQEIELHKKRPLRRLTKQEIELHMKKNLHLSKQEIELHTKKTRIFTNLRDSFSNIILHELTDPIISLSKANIPLEDFNYKYLETISEKKDVAIVCKDVVKTIHYQLAINQWPTASKGKEVKSSPVINDIKTTMEFQVQDRSSFTIPDFGNIIPETNCSNQENFEDFKKSQHKIVLKDCQSKVKAFSKNFPVYPTSSLEEVDPSMDVSEKTSGINENIKLNLESKSVSDIATSNLEEADTSMDVDDKISGINKNIILDLESKSGSDNGTSNLEDADPSMYVNDETSGINENIKLVLESKSESDNATSNFEEADPSVDVNEKTSEINKNIDLESKSGFDNATSNLEEADPSMDVNDKISGINDNIILDLESKSGSDNATSNLEEADPSMDVNEKTSGINENIKLNLESKSESDNATSNLEESDPSVDKEKTSEINENLKIDLESKSISDKATSNFKEADSSEEEAAKEMLEKEESILEDEDASTCECKNIPGSEVKSSLIINDSKTPIEFQVQNRSSFTIPDFGNIISETYCSNHENFDDFKKTQLKIVLKDCQSKEKDFSKKFPVNPTSNLEEADPSMDVNDHTSEINENKKLDLESKSVSDNATSSLGKADFSLNPKTKPALSTGEASLYSTEPSLKNARSKKRKNSKIVNEVKIKSSNDSNHSFSKSLKKCERRLDEVDSNKRQKLSHTSDDASFSGKSEKITIVRDPKRRKTISSSDDVMFFNKLKVSKKNSTVMDCKLSHKMISSTVSPSNKLQKKKIARRDSFRHVINEDQPPLFSQPDVMIKVKSADIKKRKKCINQGLNLKSQISNTVFKETNCIIKQLDNVNGEISEKQNVNNSSICDQGLSSILNMNEFKELQSEDYVTDNLIEANSSYEGKHKVSVTDEDKLLVNNNEEKEISEHKSQSIIEKEFFENTSEVSEGKNSHKDQDMKSKDELETSNVKNITSKRKSSSKIRDAKKFCEDTNSDENVYMDFDEDEEDDPDKLWCICRKPHNSRFMIQCDKCEDWFHGSCVGVTKLMGRQLEKLKKEWWCRNCSSSDASISQKKVEASRDPIIKSGFKKGLKVTDEDPRLVVQEGQQQTIMYTLDSKPKESATGKAIIQKSRESSITKSSDLSIDKRKCSAVSESDRMSKLSSSLDHEDTFKIKNPDISSQKQSSLALKKASDHLKAHLKKDSITMSSKQIIKNNLPTYPKAQSNKRIIKYKEKSVVTKKQTCAQCQKEAKTNSCYCSDNCIDKHVAKCLKSMGGTEGTTKGRDFDSQKLVVVDRMKGTVIENGPTPKNIASWLKANPSFMIVYAPSTKKEPVSQKKDSDSNNRNEKKIATDEATKATMRLNIRKTLKNILIDRCKNADDVQLPEDDVEEIAKKIEEELHSLYKDNSFKYRAKYRSLMFNIKDPRNQGLFRNILKGNITPDNLVGMSSEELASSELVKWRENENQHLLDIIRREQLDHQKTSSGLLLKKTHKGEVEIEDELTSIIEHNIPQVISKEIASELEVLPEKEVKDTTHLHRSHLFDLKCKICTGKIVPPPSDEGISKKIRVAHSISVDTHSPTDSVEKSVSKLVGAKSSVSSAGDDSVDQVQSSTVRIQSPERALRPLASNFPSKSLIRAWKGVIFMQDTTKFLSSAYKVSGDSDKLRTELPDTIQVCGRIIPDQVWDYLGKLKQSGNKELIVIYFQPANDEEAAAYQSFYSYLSSRKRYGVVSNCSKKIKDFYIVPLSAASPVPVVLVPLDGPGLPTQRPNMLLGVIVHHKFTPASTAKTTKKKQSVPKVKLAKSNSSSFPPRSYTPPLPTSQSSKDPSKEDSDVIFIPNVDFKNITKLDSTESDKEKKKKILFDSIMAGVFNSSQVNEVSDSNEVLSMKDEDKPYDPEQDILSLTANSKEIEIVYDSNETHLKESENLEQHKKILDALTRKVEETNLEVNALQQSIEVPENEAVVQSPNASLIDINSVTQTGMSSFLDLPENLQKLLNTVRSKSSVKIKKTHEKGDVDMRIKDLFGKQLNFQINEVSDSSKASKTGLSHSYSFQAEPPPPVEKSDKPVVSDSPDLGIKLKTALPQEAKLFSNVNNELSLCWRSEDEPPPPGVDVKEISAPPLPPCVSNTLGQNSQQINVLNESAVPIPTPLPLGFSKHTPPPSIQPFSTLMAPPPFPPPPPPPPLPLPIPPPPENEDSFHEVQQYSNFDQIQNNEYLYQPEMFNDNQFEPFYEEGSSNQLWHAGQNFTGGLWNPLGQGEKRF
ncbi:hypothetical protein JTE90_022969 [Oedothorax gibbosus]|uniref:PHD finger protein 3 n=1 Tax=Oedothorax gibbosus TaxID=931172 RepID=A0AAV6V9P7_9ARAC|nr:hypothetical protein JTE90_022969 [Oedothorax gibbosus]